LIIIIAHLINKSELVFVVLPKCNFPLGIKNILEAKLRLSDSQYNRLLDTLMTPSDYAYAQTMMDEIIYQLAKLMFNQGLFIGKF
jgi:hypothetical protein